MAGRGRKTAPEGTHEQIGLSPSHPPSRADQTRGYAAAEALVQAVRAVCPPEKVCGHLRGGSPWKGSGPGWLSAEVPYTQQVGRWGLEVFVSRPPPPPPLISHLTPQPPIGETMQKV